jgi:hypothetical protein
MSGLLTGYEDSDEDDDAPSILAQAAAAAVAGGDAATVGSTVVSSMAGHTNASAAGDSNAAASAEGVATPAASPPPSPAASADAPGTLARAGSTSVGGASGVISEPVRSPVACGYSSPSSNRDVSPARELDLLPPSPLGEPDADLMARVQKLHDMRKRGQTLRDHMQQNRDWSNPYILERVIKVFELDEYGSNYAKDTFDPSRIAEHPSDYYDYAGPVERPPLPKRLRTKRLEPDA